MIKEVIFKLVFSFTSALKFMAGTLAVQLFINEGALWYLLGATFLYFAAIISLWMVFD